MFLLLLSTIRQHYDLGFSSVVSLIDDLEQQLEILTLANQAPSHIKHLHQTISKQHQQIQKLSKTIENKSKELFKLNQSNHQLQQKLQLRLTKAQKIR